VESGKEELFDIVHHTCVEKKGKLLIPAFSVGRTQEIVHQLDRLESEDRLPRIDTFVDSPLSTEATEVVRDHPECYNPDLLAYMEKEKDPFGFKQLSYIRDVEDSIALNDRQDPCIIISASGMMDAGRIKHHLIHNMFDEANTLLLIGYAEPHSLGGKLRAGHDRVNVFGKMRDVKMEVKVLDHYSAHGDRDEMLDYLSCQDPEKVGRLFLVHGSPVAQEAYKEKLLEAGFSNVYIPERKEELTLSPS
jgi:metallo-beta-lactamase family protein